MRLYIDGYNVIFTVLSSLSPVEGRERLITALSISKRSAGRDWLLVFDRHHFNEPDISIESASFGRVIKTAKGQSADDCIVDFLQMEKQMSQVAVVTQDRGLSLRVKHMGGTILDPHEFWKRIRSGLPKIRPITKQTSVPLDPALLQAFNKLLDN